jgi:hypothetical protein
MATVASSRPTASAGQSIKFTAAVKPATGRGVPTGMVQFTIDGNAAATVALDAKGKAAYTTSALAAGDHAVQVRYGGDGTFAPDASPTLSQTVNRVTSSTVVTSSRNPSVYGAPLTLTARVSPSYATGIVVFWMDGDPVDDATLTSTGRGTLSLMPPPGSHMFFATYNGDDRVAPSTSATINQTVNKAGSKSVLTTSGTPATAGTPVTFTVQVKPVAPSIATPTGSVQFQIDGVNSGSPVDLESDGTAVLQTSSLTNGRHTVVALYGGDTGFVTSTSNTLTQRIT